MIGNQTVGQRQADLLADEVLVALILGVHRDGGVAEHRLRAGRGDDEMRRAVLQRIAQMPELAFLRLACTSRSDSALSSTGSQLTSRLPR